MLFTRLLPDPDPSDWDLDPNEIVSNSDASAEFRSLAVSPAVVGNPVVTNDHPVPDDPAIPDEPAVPDEPAIPDDPAGLDVPDLFQVGVHLPGEDIDNYTLDVQNQLKQDRFTPTYVDVNDGVSSDESESDSEPTPDAESDKYQKIVKIIVDNAKWKESIPLLARYHVVKWCTNRNLPKNNYDNCMAFNLIYPGKFAKSNGRWHEFVGPRWTLLGKDIDDDISAQLLVHFCHDAVVPVWSYMKSLGRDHYIFKNFAELCEFRYYSFRQSNKINLWTKLGTHLKKSADFPTGLGSKSHLLGFKDNMVYDTSRNIFRPALPTDMIAFCLPHSSGDVKVGDEQIEKEIWNFLLVAMFYSTEHAQYLLDVISYAVSGIRNEHFFLIMEGNGCNGKTVFLKLLVEMLGSYMNQPSVNLILTGGKERDVDAASPELHKCMGRLIMYTQESNSTALLNTSLCKLIGSGDTVTAMALYENTFQFPMTSFLMLNCNSCPNYDDKKDGLTRRLYVLKWLMKFYEEPDKLNKYKKMIDRELETRFSTQQYGAVFS